MNTLELSDELLNRALAVRTQAVPARLHAQVRRAIDDAAPPGGAAGRWWIGSSVLRRPVLRGAMWFALLAGLLVVVMVGTLFYVGSLPPISTAWPTPSAAASATPPPTVPPTAPPATPTPRPVVNAAEFADHVDASIASFKPAAYGLYLFVKFLDVGGAGPDALKQIWLPAESAWLNQHHPQACFEDSWRAWQSAVAEMSNAARLMVPLGETSELDFARFAAARDAIETFDPAALATCP
jgi:hypothetical protein